MDPLSRRDMFRRGGLIVAGVASGGAAPAVASAPKGVEVYTRIGVRPFINCTSTYTIIGGGMMLPEVVAAIELASHYAVNLDELMEKVGEVDLGEYGRATFHAHRHA
jgi:L-seryl-tRNA(Ser) seleniumtransferase